MKKKFIIIAFAFSLAIYGLSLSPLFVTAQGPLLSDSLIEDAECSSGNCSLNTFIALGVSLSNIILGLVGALTLAMFIYGGVTLLISGGSAEKISKGKEIILGSVVGLLIVFGSYTIIKFVVNDVLVANKKFDGSAPKDTGNAGGTKGDASICGGESNLESCINDDQVCIDSWGQEGQGINKKCTAPGQFCCKFQPVPTVTCEGSSGTSTRTCRTMFCNSGEFLSSPQLPCPDTKPLCCEGPPS